MICKSAPVKVIVSMACFLSVTGVQGRAVGSVSWDRVTANAGFHVRDSAGELVFNNKMWILGGWYNSSQPSLRDVWSSADGEHWTCVNASAPWIHGEHPVALAFDNKMWVMSGWCNGRLPGANAGNQVWHSSDGASWTQATAAAPWTARIGAAGAVLGGKMWILGGVQGYGSDSTNTPLSDVWSSSNGVDWQQATANAPWAGRGFHQVLAYDNKLWVLGGGNYYYDRSERVGSNDVWSSADGVNWIRATEHAAWDARMWHSATVYNNAMWVLGGFPGGPNGTGANYGDVWRSTDGANWTQVPADSIWQPRHEHSVYDFQDKLWVVAGNGALNDVWQAAIPTPEPSTAVLLSMLLIGLFARAWLKR